MMTAMGHVLAVNPDRIGKDDVRIRLRSIDLSPISFPRQAFLYPRHIPEIGSSVRTE